MSSSPSSASLPVLPPPRPVSPNPKPRLHISLGGNSHKNLEVPSPAKQPESSGKYKVTLQTSPKNSNAITPSTKSRSPSPSPRITVRVATPIDKESSSRESSRSRPASAADRSSAADASAGHEVEANADGKRPLSADTKASMSSRPTPFSSPRIVIKSTQPSPASAKPDRAPTPTSFSKNPPSPTKRTSRNPTPTTSTTPQPPSTSSSDPTSSSSRPKRSRKDLDPSSNTPPPPSTTPTPPSTTEPDRKRKRGDQTPTTTTTRSNTSRQPPNRSSSGSKSASTTNGNKSRTASPPREERVREEMSRLEVRLGELRRRADPGVNGFGGGEDTGSEREVEMMDEEERRGRNGVLGKRKGFDGVGESTSNGSEPSEQSDASSDMPPAKVAKVKEVNDLVARAESIAQTVLTMKLEEVELEQLLLTQGTHPEYLAQLQAIEDKKEARLKRAVDTRRHAEESLDNGLEVSKRMAGDSFIARRRKIRSEICARSAKRMYAMKAERARGLCPEPVPLFEYPPDIRHERRLHESEAILRASRTRNLLISPLDDDFVERLHRGIVGWALKEGRRVERVRRGDPRRHPKIIVPGLCVGLGEAEKEEDLRFIEALAGVGAGLETESEGESGDVKMEDVGEDVRDAAGLLVGLMGL